jgi:ribosome modulation factor
MGAYLGQKSAYTGFVCVSGVVVSVAGLWTFWRVVMSAVLSMPLEPWNEGYEAGLAGVCRCPYADSRDAWAWFSGFIEGKADRLKTI